MGGIAGIFHCGTIKPVDPARVGRMCDALAHRGPDDSGVWTAPGVGLGSRRLAIIDPAGSSQPMLSADGRAVLVFDGEIYNFRELRRELRDLGAVFRTNGDGEVILAAWNRWGVGCLPRLHGMFALAIYDTDARTLFLARDRLGVKPLFSAMLSDGSLAFASELKGLLAHPLLRREVDPLAIDDYLAWGYVPDHRSILKGVEKLAPGHYRLLRHGAGPAAPQRWWEISFAERRRGSDRDLEAELLHHLREAVTSRMIADVPVGAILTGRARFVERGCADGGGEPFTGEDLFDRLPGLRDAGSAGGERRRAVRDRSRNAHRRSERRRWIRCAFGDVRRTVRRRLGIAGLASLPTGAGERARGAFGRWRGRRSRRVSPADGPPSRGTASRRASVRIPPHRAGGAWKGLSQGGLGPARLARQGDDTGARRWRGGRVCPCPVRRVA
jgi:hypothetical protein